MIAKKTDEFLQWLSAIPEVQRFTYEKVNLHFHLFLVRVMRTDGSTNAYVWNNGVAEKYRTVREATRAFVDAEETLEAEEAKEKRK